MLLDVLFCISSWGGRGPLILKVALFFLVFCVMQVMPAVINVMKEEASLVTLVKPQFEAHRSQVSNYY